MARGTDLLEEIEAWTDEATGRNVRRMVTALRDEVALDPGEAAVALALAALGTATASQVARLVDDELTRGEGWVTDVLIRLSGFGLAARRCRDFGRGEQWVTAR